MTTARTLLIPALLTGCFNPVSGDYQITSDGEPVTDCESTDVNFDDDGDPVAVEVNDDKDAMTWGEAQSDVSGYSNDCSLDGRSFTCTFYDDGGDDGSGNEIALFAELTGQWTGSTSMEGTFVLNSSCEGDGCGDYAALGVEFCDASQDVIAELVE